MSQRKLLNLVFSANYVRYMIPIFYRISFQVSGPFTVELPLFSVLNVLFAIQLSDTIKAKISDGSQELDMMECMSRVVSGGRLSRDTSPVSFRCPALESQI